MQKIVGRKWFLGGVSCIILGILLSIWTLFDLVLEERLEMRPGLPPFDWWYDIPDIIRMKFYIFNITNAESFLNGTDAKLKVEEVGPIVFREVWSHSDLVFNDNGTMTYTVRREPVWDPSLNSIDLNATMVFPNIPVLMTASLFWDANYFARTSLNYVFDKFESKTIVTKTLYELLYNNTDPFLDFANSMLPSIAVTKNCGFLKVMYDDSSDRVTVFMGKKSGHQRFSLLDKINGTDYIPGRGDTCKDRITNASEFSLYSQFVPKDRVIKYFKKFVCRTVPLTYKEEVYRQGLKTYLFVVKKDSFNRTQPQHDDCYKGTPTLPDGLTDMSACWFKFPVVGSFPHFLYADPKLHDYVDGLKPNVSRHLPHVYVEPVSGINFRSKAIIQANIHMRPLRGFHNMFDKFSDTIIPMFYASIGNDDLPDYLVNFIKFLHMLPVIGGTLNATLFLFGAFCLWKFFNKNVYYRRIPTSIQMGPREVVNPDELEKFIDKSNTSSQHQG